MTPISQKKDLKYIFSFSSGQKEPISNSMVGNSVEATAGLRHADSVYDLEVQKNRELTRLSRVIDDSARHHYR